jgi:hypothetical protein
MIQNQSYLKMMQKQLAQSEALNNMTLADTAGLTPEHMSNIMKTMLEQREIDQKGLSDAYDAMYKSRMANVQEDQVGIQREGLGIQRQGLGLRQQEIDIDFLKMSKPEQTALTTEFDLQKSQGGFKKFNDWYKWRREQDRTESGGKTPTPLGYSSALTSLSNMYGTKSADGQFYIKPELQDAHAYALEKFDYYSKEYPDQPMEARNKAYRDAEVYRAKADRMSQILTSQGKANEIPAMLRALRGYR